MNICWAVMRLQFSSVDLKFHTVDRDQCLLIGLAGLVGDETTKAQMLYSRKDNRDRPSV